MTEKTTCCGFTIGKNILIACVLAFKQLASKSVAIMFIGWLLNIWRIQQIKSITAFIEEENTLNLDQGIWGMGWLMLNLTIKHLLDEHNSAVSYDTGVSF